jgi:hypothetical protein
MTLINSNRIPKLDYLILLPILGLAFYIAFIPHQNYPYPLHVDEWVHLGHSKMLMGAGSVTFHGSALLEAGFHLFWGVFQTISGISWMAIFRYFPGIIFIITVLSVYILAQREGFGLEAAFLTCLIPTTVGILGPAFLVPVAMGLLFVPLSLFVAFNFRTWWSYLVLLLFTSFLLSIHAPSAICLVIILIPYILLNLKGSFKHSLGMTLVLAIPFLAPFPWIFTMLLPTAKSLLTPQPLTEFVDLPWVIQTYGYLPILFCLLGTFLLAMRGGRKNYSLVLGLLALLLMLVTFFTFHYGVPIMYERGLMYMMLMLSIVAGAGLMAVKNLRLPDSLSTYLKAPLITNNLGKIFCLTLIVITLVISIPVRQHTLYYHMIDTEDYEAFVWIKDNIGENYEKAILDPWKATAFTAITEKQAYTRLHTVHRPKDKEAYAFLKNGSSDTAFLRENGISVIYTRYGVDNPDLVELAKNIYLLKESE